MVRVKNRYLLVNILYPSFTIRARAANDSGAKVPDLVEFHQPTTDALTPQLLLKGIRSLVAELFGDYGSGAIASSLMVKYLSPATSTFILRVSRAHYRLVWAALCFMDSIPVKDGQSCVFQVVRVSGTIRKAEEEAIRRAREMILRARRDLSEQGEETLQRLLGQGQKDSTARATVVMDSSDVVDEDEDDDKGMSDTDG